MDEEGNNRGKMKAWVWALHGFYVRIMFTLLGASLELWWLIWKCLTQKEFEYRVTSQAKIGLTLFWLLGLALMGMGVGGIHCSNFLKLLQ